jgi:diaminohydroxyphosphoribosylaminopyrimidine deaminase / 5-amino-6-(5-phosphoribosylamino)uracil reductase
VTALEAMKLAIAEGKKGAGFVSPNPLVGCVILDKNGEILSKGYHARVGEAHAEINALDSVRGGTDALKGAHVYVTLEPCAHQGRTGACAIRLANLPIASVTYGIQDPNPLVAGKGAEILRQAGKKVELFTSLKSELEELAEIFLTNMRLKRPFVGLKVASSLDGKVALRDGTSQWITGDSARQNVHYLRGAYDAVLSGSGTFLRDNPRLNSRHPMFENKPQRVILLDSDGKTYPYLKTSELVKVRSADDLWIVTGPGIDAPPVGRQIKVTDRDRNFDLSELMTILQSEGVHSVLVESGPLTASSFIKNRLVDRLYLYMAPKLMGDGLSWTSAFSLAGLDQAVRIENLRVETYDQDLLLTGIPRWP